MNEAESSLAPRQQIVEEIFFNEEAHRIRKAFNEKTNEHDLVYLRRQLKYIKNLTTILELPWDNLISILFRFFSAYMQHPDKNMNHQKVHQQTALLMDSMSFLSKNPQMIHALSLYFDQKIKDLDKLLEEKKLKKGLLDE